MMLNPMAFKKKDIIEKVGRDHSRIFAREINGFFFFCEDIFFLLQTEL